MDEQNSNVGQQAQVIKERAVATTAEAADVVKHHAKDLSTQAKDRIETAAEVHKTGFADELGNLGRVFERSGREVGQEGSSVFTEPLQQVAQFCQQASESLRNKSSKELFAEVEAFGRRQPTALLGIAMAAGFFATRLLRSDSKQAQQEQTRDGELRSNNNAYAYQGRH